MNIFYCVALFIWLWNCVLFLVFFHIGHDVMFFISFCYVSFVLLKCALFSCVLLLYLLFNCVALWFVLLCFLSPCFLCFVNILEFVCYWDMFKRMILLELFVVILLYIWFIWCFYHVWFVCWVCNFFWDYCFYSENLCLINFS